MDITTYAGNSLKIPMEKIKNVAVDATRRAMYLKFNDNEVNRTIVGTNQVFIDVAVDGTLVGIEVLVQ